MDEDDLRWRVERACRDAWPPHEEAYVAGWRLCHGDDGTRRGTSAHPAVPDAALTPDGLARIERWFRERGRSPRFRIPDFASAATHLLDDGGYRPPEGATRTLMADLAAPCAPDRPVILDATATPAWRSARAALADPNRNEARTLDLITVPAAFAASLVSGGIVAVGYTAIAHGVAVLEAIATHPHVRRQGHARAIVAALLRWAADAGAPYAALQVAEVNAPARALYANAGFTTDLYGYHYRRSAA